MKKVLLFAMSTILLNATRANAYETFRSRDFGGTSSQRQDARWGHDRDHDLGHSHHRPDYRRSDIRDCPAYRNKRRMGLTTVTLNDGKYRDGRYINLTYLFDLDRRGCENMEITAVRLRATVNSDYRDQVISQLFADGRPVSRGEYHERSKGSSPRRLDLFRALAPKIDFDELAVEVYNPNAKQVSIESIEIEWRRN